MLTNKHCIFALLVAVVGTINISYYKGIIGYELVDKGMNEDNVGYVISINSICYLVACLLVPYTCENSSRKFMFFIAMVGFSFSNLMLGPSKILNIPDSIWLIIGSQPLMGVF
jgi:predicted MFS family arabinose efflux permease